MRVSVLPGTQSLHGTVVDLGSNFIIRWWRYFWRFSSIRVKDVFTAVNWPVIRDIWGVRPACVIAGSFARSINFLHAIRFLRTYRGVLNSL